MSDRRVLIVSYDFPPAGGSGVQRALKLARYLPKAGWTPTILSCGHDRQTLRDDLLADELPRNTNVIRLPGWEPPGLTHSLVRALGNSPISRLHHGIDWRANHVAAQLGLPELPILWSFAACQAVIDIIRRERITAVITTGPPHSTHLVGRHAQKRLGIRWIADLRDPIVSNFSYHPSNRLADRFWRWLESSIACRADQIVVTCDDLADDLTRRHPPLNRSAISTITNGWDTVDFSIAIPSRRSAATFTLTYVGAFYREQSIEPFLESFRRILARRRDFRSRLRLEHVGSLSREQARVLRPADDQFLIRRGYADHHSAVAAMRASDALLLTVPINAGGRLCIPAKTFEYLATDRPILAFAHPGTQLTRLLESAGGVTILPNLEPATIADAIESLADASPTARPAVRRSASVLHESRRDILAARYAALLDQATGRDARLTLQSAAQYWQPRPVPAAPRFA